MQVYWCFQNNKHQVWTYFVLCAFIQVSLLCASILWYFDEYAYTLYEHILNHIYYCMTCLTWYIDLIANLVLKSQRNSSTPSINQRKKHFRKKKNWNWIHPLLSWSIFTLHICLYSHLLFTLIITWRSLELTSISCYQFTWGWSFSQACLRVDTHFKNQLITITIYHNFNNNYHTHAIK